MGKIKVLQTIRQGKIGGGESHVLTLVKELDKNIFEPVVLSFTPGPMVDELEKAGIKTHVIYTEKGFDFSVTKQVKQLLIDEKIELVHNHGTRATSNLWWACRGLKIPMLYTVHGWSFHDDQSYLYRKARITSEWLLTSQVNTTISVSYSNQKSGQEEIPKFKSEVIRYGIDVEKFDYTYPNSTVRADYNIPDDKVIIGYVVRMDIQKDPITMVKAYKQVCEKQDNMILLMIGEGPLLQQAKDLIKEYGLEDKVIFDKFRQDVPNVLAGIDIYCLPSLWEGLPIGMLEALAMRKCIVATGVDGSKEVLVDEENALVIEPQNPSMLAEKLIRAVSDADLRDRLSANALKTIQAEFTAAIMTRKVEDLYLRTLGKK